MFRKPNFTLGTGDDSGHSWSTVSFSTVWTIAGNTGKMLEKRWKLSKNLFNGLLFFSLFLQSALKSNLDLAALYLFFLSWKGENTISFSLWFLLHALRPLILLPFFSKLDRLYSVELSLELCSLITLVAFFWSSVKRLTFFSWVTGQNLAECYSQGSSSSEQRDGLFHISFGLFT